MSLPSRLRTAWRTTRDPLVTDRRYDVATFLTWFFYAGWGLLTAFSDLTVFGNLTRLDAGVPLELIYPTLWGGAIGVAALTAAIAGMSTFFLHPSCYMCRIRAKRVEMVAVCAMLGLLVVYPATILLTGDANGNPRLDIFSLACSYFPLAVFRVQHLQQRVKQLYAYRLKSGGED